MSQYNCTTIKTARRFLIKNITINKILMHSAKVEVNSSLWLLPRRSESHHKFSPHSSSSVQDFLIPLQDLRKEGWMHRVTYLGFIWGFTKRIRFSAGVKKQTEKVPIHNQSTARQAGVRTPNHQSVTGLRSSKLAITRVIFSISTSSMFYIGIGVRRCRNVKMCMIRRAPNC